MTTTSITDDQLEAFSDLLFERLSRFEHLRAGANGPIADKWFPAFVEACDAAAWGHLTINDVAPVTDEGRTFAAWWAASAQRAAWDAHMQAQAVDVACPTWCSGEHARQFTPARSTVRHTRCVDVGDQRVRVALEQLDVHRYPISYDVGALCEPTTPEVTATVDGAGTGIDLSFEDPHLVRRLAQALLEAADLLTDAQAQQCEALQHQAQR